MWILALSASVPVQKIYTPQESDYLSRAFQRSTALSHYERVISYASNVGKCVHLISLSEPYPFLSCQCVDGEFQKRTIRYCSKLPAP